MASNSRRSIAAKQVRGTCVYCQRSLPAKTLTRDHVIAEAWYPTSTPPNTEKWKVDSCARCNHSFGKIEQEMLIRFGLCLDPNARASASIVQKAMASINPELGKTERDRRARQALRGKILSDVRQVDTRPTKGLLPDFGRNWDQGSRHMVLVPGRELHQIIRKWVRGLHYLTLGRLLPRSARIDVFHVTNEVAGLAFRDIEPYAPIHIKPPGVSVMQASATEGATAATIYRFVLWDQYMVCAAVSEHRVAPDPRGDRRVDAGAARR
jgi:hypothetical protein